MVEPGLPLRVTQYPNVWHRLKSPIAPQINWAQITLLFLLSPPGTFTLCGYIWKRGREGEAGESQEPGAETKELG